MAKNFVGANSQRLKAASAPISGYPVTIACWVRVASAQNSVCMVSVGNDAGSARLHVGLNATSAPIMLVSDASNVQENAISTVPTVNNTWEHVVAVWYSSTLRTIYHNNVAYPDATTVNMALGAVNSVLIGARAVAGVEGGFMDGDIAEVAIWNDDLSAGDIESLYNGVMVRHDALVFYDPLLSPQDSPVEWVGGVTLTASASVPTTVDGPATVSYPAPIAPLSASIAISQDPALRLDALGESSLLLDTDSNAQRTVASAEYIVLGGTAGSRTLVAQGTVAITDGAMADITDGSLTTPDQTYKLVLIAGNDDQGVYDATIVDRNA